jgi:hypothetical protein
MMGLLRGAPHARGQSDPGAVRKLLYGCEVGDSVRIRILSLYGDATKIASWSHIGSHRKMTTKAPNNESGIFTNNA